MWLATFFFFDDNYLFCILCGMDVITFIHFDQEKEKGDQKRPDYQANQPEQGDPDNNPDNGNEWMRIRYFS